ncbi:MAG: methyl-accepting chemotaxis protein, partial [Spirochaetota bacterium]
VRLIGAELKNMAEGGARRTVRVDTHDDLGELAFWLDSLGERFEIMVGHAGKLVRTAHECDMELNRKLRHAGGVLQGLFADLENLGKLGRLQLQAMESITKQFQEYAGSVSQTSEHSTLLAENFLSFTQHIRKHSRFAQEFLNGIGNLQHSLGNQNSSDLLGVMVQFAKESSRSIDDQAQRFSRIEKLLEEIEDIAESTHLLSINASIEAARAGESGSGFTIVALQIRNLATNAAALTSEIRGQMEAVMNGTKTSGVQLADLRAVLNTRMEDVLSSVQHLVSVGEDSTKVGETVALRQQELKGAIEDICYRFTGAGLLGETLLQPMAELNDYMEKLGASVGRIDTSLAEVNKVVEFFSSQDAFADVLSMGSQMQGLMEMIGDDSGGSVLGREDLERGLGEAGESFA